MVYLALYQCFEMARSVVGKAAYETCFTSSFMALNKVYIARIHDELECALYLCSRVPIDHLGYNIRTLDARVWIKHNKIRRVDEGCR